MWQIKSKTMHAGIVTIVWGILILFGLAEGPPPQTIDQMGQDQKAPMQTVVGVGALLSGLLTLKGRGDAQKKIDKGDTDEK